MAAFRKTLQERYPDEIVMVRPNSSTLSLVAYKKFHGDARWVDCEETHAIPLGIMLPGYNPPGRITLPPVASRRVDTDSGVNTASTMDTPAT